MLIDRYLKFQLPHPWRVQIFETRKIGAINLLVGPNGSGKSQFAKALLGYMRSQGWETRFLGTDRLSEMTRSPEMERQFGGYFSEGINKSHFSSLKMAGEEGSGIDTIVLLEERMDLRIQIEATLSHLFDREILWDSGRLIPKAILRGHSQSYRLDRDECHGIKELLVMLTHLYDDQKQYLIIDEPELNLHPQYQSFFMQEVRKVAGDPSTDGTKKIVFLITHSPFILDFRSEEDLRGVISCDLEYSVPKQVHNLLPSNFPYASFVGRLNGHHRQFFFSDSPIFVEGIRDARIVEAMMEARGVSIAGAGSCIIDVGGSGEVSHYLELCKGLAKEAHFLYDLDSLFRGHLRSRIKRDESIRLQMAKAGHGKDLDTYCGSLDQKLTEVIDRILTKRMAGNLATLDKYLQSFGPHRSNWDKQNLRRARTAVVTAIKRYRQDMVSVLSEEEVSDIEGRVEAIVTVLKERNIHLLPGGTLERYLPSYSGNEYAPTEDAKQRAMDDEIQVLSKPMTEDELAARYEDLYKAVCSMPSKTDVDVEFILRKYLSNYIHELQQAVSNNSDWQLSDIQTRLNTSQPETTTVFSVQTFERYDSDRFEALIEVAEMLGQPKRVVRVSERTNAGMSDFQIEPYEVNQGIP